jgi:hypothetical protein
MCYKFTLSHCSVARLLSAPLFYSAPLPHCSVARLLGALLFYSAPLLNCLTAQCSTTPLHYTSGVVLGLQVLPSPLLSLSSHFGESWHCQCSVPLAHLAGRGYGMGRGLGLRRPNRRLGVEFLTASGAGQTEGQDLTITTRLRHGAVEDCTRRPILLPILDHITVPITVPVFFSLLPVRPSAG